MEVNENAENSLAHLLEQVEGLVRVQNEQGDEVARVPSTNQETIGDDFDISPEKLAQIEHEEALMRRALALFDVDYDSLVRMDGQSAYSQAVTTKPEVLEMVKNAQSPVLAAMQVAVQFKPYAEFSEKYGNTPDDIRNAIRSEVEKEMQSKTKKQLKEKAAVASKGAAFSSLSGKGSKAPKAGSRLTDIFGK